MSLGLSPQVQNEGDDNNDYLIGLLWVLSDLAYVKYLGINLGT